ncbi:MAG TPA: TonB family protein [Pyrinomonadaceae bacterium]|nr:TonB family protein [Pyrinomonadaceae bacterium]
MKTKLFVLLTLVVFTGCSLFGSPQATVKKFMADAQKGDVNAMTDLFSKNAISKMGLDKIKENNKIFADTTQRVAAGGSKYRMEDMRQESTATGERVSFLYKDESGVSSIRMTFDLSKEGGAWKIDYIGDAADKENTVAAPAISSPEVKELTPPAPPGPGAPISGGVLNEKAISLPKPPYPPIARAAKISGTVVVQVTVDENGDVISAQALSGHPLLRAASITAARAAKFQPTKLAGQPVKVNGVINYVFEPPAN